MAADPVQDVADQEVQTALQVEVQPQFVPTPDAISRLLENVRTNEVAAQLESVDGRDKIFESLLENEAKIRELDPHFSTEELRTQLDLVGDTLRQKQRFLQDARSPEKKGVFRRAWDKVKGFTEKHPVVTTVLVLSLAAAGVATGFYFTGNWELLLGKLGVSKWLGSAETAKELIPPTPLTPPLPGGGLYDIPMPNLPPGHQGVL